MQLTCSDFEQEEKVRHAQQYPDYRFQPRHKSKSRGSGSTPSSSDKLRCNKCGGRSIVSTGSLPSSPPITGSFNTVTSVTSNSTTSIATPTTRTLPQLRALTLNSPHGVNSNPGLTPFTPFNTPTSMTDSKRRRYNPYPPTSLAGRSRENSVHPATTNGQSNPSQYQSVPMGSSSHREPLPPPTPSTHFHRSSISVASGAHPTQLQSPTSMGPPPPRGSIGGPGLHSYPQTPRLPFPQGQESLRLPPLQHTVDPNQPIENLINNMPYLAKIKILRRIAQPLKSPGSSTSVPPGSIVGGASAALHRNRGSIIAVEGDPSTPVDTVLSGLEGSLRRFGEFDVKVMNGPQCPASKAEFKALFEEVGRWHAHANNLHAFITRSNDEVEKELEVHRRSIATAAYDDYKMDIESIEADAALRPDHERRDSDVSRASAGSKRSDKSTHSHSSLFSPTQSTVSFGASTQRKIPIVLIPRYLVHASNAWATAVPINDAYSPTDHWQWMATLWRDVPGADFTVYVRNENASSQNEDEHPPGTPARAPATFGDAWGNPKVQVDIREDIRTLVVRNENGKVDDAAIRRVAFEVGEWARFGAGSGR